MHNKCHKAYISVYTAHYIFSSIHPMPHGFILTAAETQP
jgi:hypothetical protein